MMQSSVPTDSHLLRNCLQFGRLLRAVGIQVTPTQLVDLTESLRYISVRNRQDFKHAARAILINRQEHLSIFERAFDLFWQAHSDGTLMELNLGQLRRRTNRSTIEWRSEQNKGGADEDARPDESEAVKLTTYSDEERLRHQDFATLNEAELAAIVQMMTRFHWQLAPRKTRRRQRVRTGHELDLRRTFRQSLHYGGEPFQLARKRRKIKPRPLVLLCDLSGSMERYARLLLQFIYIVTNRADRVESFIFSTRLTRITRQLRTRSVERALQEAAASIHDWGGGTRIGEAIRRFNYDWARRVLGQGAVVLIISDGWDRGDIELLGREMDRLHRSCHRLIWLNPRLGAPGYEPLVRGIQAALPHVDDFLPVHNLASLEQLAAILQAI